DSRSENDAEEASHCREQRRLQQKLPSDIALPSPERPPDADLFRPLDDRNEHDIGNDDRSDDERNPRDQDHERKSSRRDALPEALKQLRRDQAEGILLAE